MKVPVEVFGGIEFVRISNLPEDQKEFITCSISRDRIIKILKDKVVIGDCIQYHDYNSLYNQYKTKSFTDPEKQHAARANPPTYKLAFK
jgi:hypothetical protein